MTRQRISLRTPALALVVRTLTVLLALVALWYGLMVVLLALKVSPHTVNDLSGFRTLFNDLTSLSEHDFTTRRRLIIGGGGLLLFGVLFMLALQDLPRPHLARREVRLPEDARGVTSVAPRAVERLAEAAAGMTPGVSAVAGRLGDGELNLSVALRRAGHPAEDLRAVQSRVREAVVEHGLPDLPVNVTLTGYDRPKRELP